MSNEQLAISNESQTRQMKDSGVEWIGEIPAQWDVSTINSLYTLRNQKVSDRDYLPLSVTMKGIVPQLETAAKTDAHDDRKLVKKGDFAINSRSDRRGSCGISNYDGSVSLINTVLTPRGKMHPVYYNWLFHSARFADEFYRWGHGIVDDLWTTRWQEMRNITIPVPEYAVQQKIAAYLDRKCTQIDTLIANQQQQIEKLKAYKQSVITETVTKGLDPDVAMKDSGVEWIGEIPYTWSLKATKRLFVIESGATPKSDNPDNFDGDIVWITPADYTTEQVYITDSRRKLTELGLKTCSTSLIPPNSIIFSKRAPIGLVAINHVELCTNQGCLSCISKTNDLIKYYYYVMSIFTDQYNLLGSGTTFKEISLTSFSNFILPCPPVEEQQHIAEYLDQKCEQIDRLIAIKQQKIEKLQQYKKSLIYEYVTGKKEVI